MIIDFRLRPPVGKLKDNFVFDEDFLMKYAKDCGTSIATSAKERSIELLLTEMQEVGIVKGVLPLRKYSTNASFTENIGGVYSNEDLMLVLQEYPDYFVGMAGLDFAEGMERMIQEVDQYVIHGSCKGVFLEPSVGMQPVYANDSGMYPIYDYCQSHQVLALMTFGGTGGFNGRCYLPEVIDQVARAFPKLKMVISHGGWPWVGGICSVACNHENIYISPDLYGINSPGYQDYVLAANYRLQDKILFGSAYPCVSLKDAVNFYSNSGLHEHILPKVMYHNAARLLGLE